MKYRVELSAPATVSAVVEVEAETKSQAEDKAISEARQGNVFWNYEGADDKAIEICDVDQIEGRSIGVSNKWELYSNHPDFEQADRGIERAWIEAIGQLPGASSVVRARAAEEHVYGVMSRWQHLGALDTEPLAELRRRVVEHFGVSGGWL